jgi:hypothetical protein
MCINARRCSRDPAYPGTKERYENKINSERSIYMKRNTVLTMLFTAALLLSLPAAASAKDHNYCSIRDVAGEYGYSWTGTVILPTGAVPAAATGIATIDYHGNVRGKQTGVVGGQVSNDIVIGTVTGNPDCTGSMTVDILNESGNLLRTVVWDTVALDDGKEVRSIVRSMVLPNGMALPAVITMNSKRLFSDNDDEYEGHHGR